RRATVRIGSRPHSAAVILNDRTRDAQPDSHTAWLSGEEGLKQPRHAFRLDALAGIANRDLHTAALGLTRAQVHHPRPIAVVANRIEGVCHQVHQYLKQLRAIADNSRKRGGQIELYRDTFGPAFHAEYALGLQQDLPQIHERHLNLIALKDRANVAYRLHGP